jgi:hypothetical protein
MRRDDAGASPSHTQPPSRAALRPESAHLSGLPSPGKQGLGLVQYDFISLRRGEACRDGPQACSSRLGTRRPSAS